MPTEPDSTKLTRLSQHHMKAGIDKSQYDFPPVSGATCSPAAITSASSAQKSTVLAPATEMQQPWHPCHPGREQNDRRTVPNRPRYRLSLHVDEYPPIKLKIEKTLVSGFPVDKLVMARLTAFGYSALHNVG
ncbi:hypothetical protein J7T55_003711 [Diaporthe amygdali]|uniref:uncharacterized protein n=1 Tax=Phomopsis amygdali TaxID=1214568 RepID=UPI0022FF0791|nr:uncharacterized protein J7T55_003711 [Diaporthe amygdali]KAJ0117299.1 hypothetical protein J7T55_003711 [Diaporthe amygdali]